MKIILKNQLEYGVPNYSNPYNYTISDFEAIIPLTKQELKNRGFKFPTDNDFADRINSIFRRVLNSKSDSKYIYVNFLNKCDRDFIYFPNNIYDYFGVFVIKNDNYITESFAIPQLIDYQKKFPDLANGENLLPKTFIYENGEEVSKYFWKDDKNLMQRRQQNIETLVNRNKYLFNDNKASLVWLKFHDEYFLEQLVKTFGYVKDQDLLKWVLDKNLIKIADEDLQEFGKILWTKTCDNNIIVHKEVFDFIAKQDKTTFKNYNLSLRVFAEDFKDDNLSFSEVAKIKALVCYYGTKMTDDNLFSYFFNVRDQKYEEEFKKNNYYNLPDFKEIYELTRKGGISLPGEIE